MIKFLINVCAEKGTVRLTVRSCHFDKFQIFHMECSGHIEKIVPKFSIIATAAHGGSKMILFGTVYDWNKFFMEWSAVPERKFWLIGTNSYSCGTWRLVKRRVCILRKIIPTLIASVAHDGFEMIFSSTYMNKIFHKEFILEWAAEPESRNFGLSE